ncbi:hypothetical protein GCM10009809_15860 [Isoptericola hypogeus]|uniref:Uncharacterized protein n=1 Tax=Isoptericola hypogeus TaxID=300179 RepID=A0ABP4VAI6_9MICO
MATSPAAPTPDSVMNVRRPTPRGSSVRVVLVVLVVLVLVLVSPELGTSAGAFSPLC